MRPKQTIFVAAIALPILLHFSARLSPLFAESAEPEPDVVELAKHVVATAYNSVPEQTSDDPWLTASGERLRPGKRVIAVSRDLEAQGLGFGTEVRIEGLPGTYVVSDRTAPRWKGRIDIWMGVDLHRAKHWGKRIVKIVWTPKTVVAANPEG